MKNKIILINGPIASGKTSVAKALSEKIEDSIFIDLDEEVKNIHGSLNWDNEDERFKDWIDARHKVAIRCINELNNNKSVIISGPFYTFDELHYFVKYLPDKTYLLLFTLDVSLEERLRRDSLRAHSNSEVEMREQLSEISKFVTSYGYKIENETSINITVEKILGFISQDTGKLDISSFY